MAHGSMELGQGPGAAAVAGVSGGRWVGWGAAAHNKCENPEIMKVEVVRFSHNKIEKLLVQHEAE